MYLLCRTIILVISTWDGFSMHWCRICYLCVQWLYFWSQLLILYISFWCRVNCLTIKMLLILESDAHFVCHCTGKLYRTALSYCATSFSQWFKVSSAYISLLGLHNWCEQAGKLVFLCLLSSLFLLTPSSHLRSMLFLDIEMISFYLWSSPVCVIDLVTWQALQVDFYPHASVLDTYTIVLDLCLLSSVWELCLMSTVTELCPL